VLLRLAYLTVTNTFTVLRLLPLGDRDKDIEILALRHQIAVLERQLGGKKVRFTAPDRAILAAMLHRVRPAVLHRLRLLVRPDTVLRWHRDLLAGRHASRSKRKRPGRPPTVRSIRVLVASASGRHRRNNPVGRRDGWCSSSAQPRSHISASAVRSVWRSTWAIRLAHRINCNAGAILQSFASEW
jgi:hypothetical protein